MKEQARTIFFYGSVAVLITLAVYAVAKARNAGSAGESGARVWFYDQSRDQLYSASRDLIPPDGDGDVRVRAMVVGFQGMGSNARELKIAYLEKYGPEYKALLQRAEAAHAARRPFMETLPAQNSEYHLNNTFVKRPAEPAWHTIGSEEARDILAEWHAWRGPAGQLPIISLPPMH